MFIEADCIWDNTEFLGSDSFNLENIQGEDCFKSLIRACSVTDPQAFVGKQVYARYVKKKLDYMQIDEYMSVRDFNMKNPASQM